MNAIADIKKVDLGTDIGAVKITANGSTWVVYPHGKSMLWTPGDLSISTNELVRAFRASQVNEQKLATEAENTTKKNANAQVIELGDEYGPAEIRVHKNILRFDADNKPTLFACWDVTAITDGPINVYNFGRKDPVALTAPSDEQTDAATAATVTQRAYKIGDCLPDGWVVGPRSPDTGFVMAIEPALAAPLDPRNDFSVSGGVLDWDNGIKHSYTLRQKGHFNAHMPSVAETRALNEHIVVANRNQNACFAAHFWIRNTSWNQNTDSTRLAHYTYLGGKIPFTSYEQAKYEPTIFPVPEPKDFITRAHTRCVRDEPSITLIPG